MKVYSGCQFFIALLFILGGVVLLLVNLGLISMEIDEAIHFLYPFVLTIIGLKLLFDLLATKGKHGNWFFGTFLTLIGVMLAADRLGYWEFSFREIVNYWPLLFVYIGLRILMGKRPIIKVTAKSSKNGFVTDVSMKENNWQVEDLDEWNGVADYDFDYTKAFIPDRDTKIKLAGWVGDIKILIPEDVEFSLIASSKVGDVKIGHYSRDGIMKNANYKTDGYDEATRKLTFNIDFQVLDLRIDRV
ncbi:cell wall-active antibiotics response protein LiaF [Pseudalkalibacillus sp. SCS-8]|uniref:cell wall-active antibiotics response protein LiaF n=1 Tax=Pseudalkalibacillus nanhaiensis TaxID=3115291 RepID=UPI0032DA18D6